MPSRRAQRDSDFLIAVSTRPARSRPTIGQTSARWDGQQPCVSCERVAFEQTLLRRSSAVYILAFCSKRLFASR
jgi:hypothetical protein